MQFVATKSILKMTLLFIFERFKQLSSNQYLNGKR